MPAGPSFRCPPANATPDNDFNDPKGCAACHTDIFSQWEGSLHSQGYDEEKTAFRVPDGGAFPITVDAKLHYRSMSQAFADIFTPEGSMKIPVIRMAEGGYAFGKPAVKAAATP